MKKLFIFLSLITILYTIFYPSFVLKKDTFEPVQKEEIFVDIDHSKQLDDDTDIDYYIKEWSFHNYAYRHPEWAAKFKRITEEEAKERSADVDLNTNDADAWLYKLFGGLFN